MKLPTSLSVYFGRQFALWICGTFATVTVIIFLLDLTELMRRGADRSDATFAAVFEMALLKTPQMIQIALPFSVLAGCMLAITRMTRNQELTVARSAGVSVWQFLLPALLFAFCLGVFRVTVFNPFASVTTEKFEALENRILRNRASALAVAPSGIWLRERTPEGQSVLHARNITGDGVVMSDVIIFQFEGTDRFLRRIDADTVRLEPGYWTIDHAVIINRDAIPAVRQNYRLETMFTIDNIQDSFFSPDTMSFWDLPGFISLLEEAGFSAVRHRLHWHALLASPVLLCAMVLIAATFSLRLTRKGGTVIWASTGLFFGFLLYFVSDLVFALGLSSRIPEILAAWTPATVSGLLGIAGLLHLEDG